jgi:hypothetical protein
MESILLISGSYFVQVGLSKKTAERSAKKRQKIVI